MAVLTDIPPPISTMPWLTSIEALPAEMDTHFQLILRVADPAARLRALANYPRPSSCRLISPPALQRVAEMAANMDIIHIMRLYLAPLIEHLQPENSAWLSLDCDDDDSAYHLLRANRLENDGQSETAAFERAEAAKYQSLSKKWVPRFNKVFMASSQDLGAFDQNQDKAFLPNISDYKTTRVSPPPSDDLRMLFVGNLAYAPNMDAVRWLAQDLLPSLDMIWDRGIKIDIVGGGLCDPPPCDPRLRFHGQVPDVLDFYNRCDLSLVPLRYGSGVPLKLLEAFALQVPVVTTSYAARAAGTTEKHCYIADEAIDFAQNCVRAKKPTGHTAQLIAEAAQRVVEQYSAKALETIIAAEFPSQP